MRTVIAILMLTISLPLLVYGLWLSLGAIVNMYHGALNDPMNPNQPEGAEIRDTVLRGVLIAAPGIVLFSIGFWILSYAVYQRIRRKWN